MALCKWRVYLPQINYPSKVVVWHIWAKWRERVWETKLWSEGGCCVTNIRKYVCYLKSLSIHLQCSLFSSSSHSHVSHPLSKMSYTSNETKSWRFTWKFFLSILGVAHFHLFHSKEKKISQFLLCSVAFVFSTFSLSPGVWFKKERKEKPTNFDRVRKDVDIFDENFSLLYLVWLCGKRRVCVRFTMYVAFYHQLNVAKNWARLLLIVAVILCTKWEWEWEKMLFDLSSSLTNERNNKSEGRENTNWKMCMWQKKEESMKNGLEFEFRASIFSELTH